MKPTTEQQAILDHFRNPDFGNTKIIAYAGTGKTTTLKMIANEIPDKRILNLSFNKKIADESALTFPKNVESRTFHSFALRNLNGVVLASTPMEFVNLIKERLDIKNFTVLWASYFTMNEFCQSSETLPILPHIFNEKNLNKYEEKKLKQMQSQILDTTTKMWKSYMENPSTPCTHSMYLKKFSLLETIPVKDYDVIFVDEVQDSNPTMLDVLAKIDKQKVVVGDPYQQIFSFTGAINALDKVDFETFYLSQSFRWGDDVASLSNKILVHLDSFNKEKPVRGTTDKITPTNFVGGLKPSKNHDAILCRYNKTCFSWMKYCYDNEIPYYNAMAEDLLKEYFTLLQLKSGKGDVIYYGYKKWLDLMDAIFGGDCHSPNPWIAILISTGKDRYFAEVMSGSSNKGGCMEILTSHKSKGLEWDNVYIADDFFTSSDKIQLGEEEFRLYYVACTRARKVLDVGSTYCEKFDKMGQVRASLLRQNRRDIEDLINK